MAKQEALKVAVIAAVATAAVGALTTKSTERIFDMFIPSPDAPAPAPAPIQVKAGRTIVTYPDDVELVARPNVRAWGTGESAESLASATREQVVAGLRLPAELAATQIHYRISDVAFGGAGRKQLAKVEIAMMEGERGQIRCGPVSLAFRDSRDLSQQIQAQLNGILLQSYTSDRLSCG